MYHGYAVGVNGAGTRRDELKTNIAGIFLALALRFLVHQC